MKPDASTTLYGIIGHPVSHSLSPAMHNAAFNALGINGVYLAFDVTDLPSAVKGIKALGIKGLSVTIPHKVEIMGFLDEVDEVARRIGAVNTIVNRDGRLWGGNTDWIGAVKALEEQTQIEGKRAVVLGAGGSARAVCAGLKERGALVHIVNRTVENARKLAERFDCSWSGFDEIQDMEGEILVNTTSVGMEPDSHKTPVPSAITERFSIVMDIVYAPLKTRLLDEAEKAGCVTINGLRMLLLQAVAQFELWTGEKAPVDVMEKILYSRFA